MSTIMHNSRYLTKHFSTDISVIKNAVADSARALFLSVLVILTFVSSPLGRLVY